MNPRPAPAKPTASKRPQPDETTAEIGGAVLALLILGGIVGAILNRRRKRREQEEADAQTMAFEPFETSPAPEPQVVEPAFREEPVVAAAAPAASAFAWGNAQPCDEPLDDGSDRCPGETWVERAYRGPSPANPSVSLKARLKRAAFFDKRERGVAAGRAEPVDIDAGLPDALVDEQAREPA
jgi:hypothetical protein